MQLLSPVLLIIVYFETRHYFAHHIVAIFNEVQSFHRNEPQSKNLDALIKVTRYCCFSWLAAPRGFLVNCVTPRCRVSAKMSELKAGQPYQSLDVNCRQPSALCQCDSSYVSPCCISIGEWERFATPHVECW